ncbi:MAG TPA: T9SS type A sorting domain-containing protein [Chitinophagales bacterium]|nr:T9SS type A sorting domain-containing protein [Chitinophagales bacterium]
MTQRKSTLIIISIAASWLLFTNGATDLNEPCDSPVVGGHAGAPGSPGCEYCHGGIPNTGPGSVIFDLGNGINQYVPGTTYDATVATQQSGIDKFGFVVTARKSTNASVGDFIVLDTFRTRKFTESGKKYFSHTPCGADADVIGTITWNFQWTAPSIDEGAITFYLSSLAANHDHDLTGDSVYALTKVLDVATAVIETASTVAMELFPNPATDKIFIRLKNGNAEIREWNFNLYSLQGKLLTQKIIHSNETTVDLKEENLSDGIYIAEISNLETYYYQKIMFNEK